MACLLSLALFAFLMIVRPFGPAVSSMKIFLNAFLAALITFATILFNYTILLRSFPGYFKEEKWTIGREIVLTLLILVTISIANITAAHFLGGNRFSVKNATEMFFYTTAFGVAPATAAIIINQGRLVRKYKNRAAGLSAVLQETSATTDVLVQALQEMPHLVIYAENEKDKLVLKAEDLIAAISADNYIKLYYLEDGRENMKIIRTTLKSVEDSSASFAFIWRCHRTAVVNLSKVEKTTGNAQGYKLILKNSLLEIPVSRSLNYLLKEKLLS